MKRRPKGLIYLILLSLVIGTLTCQISHEQTHAGYILSHKTKYPDELVELVERNIETADFVYQYPKLVEEGKNTAEYSNRLKLTKKDLENRDGLLLQWDERWGAIPYGKSMLALSGCGPTCLSMASLILTGNKKNTPSKVAEYAMEQGYYVMNQGTSWDLFNTGCEHFGMTSEIIQISQNEIEKALNHGAVLVASVKPGDFTTSGHFIVIDGCNGDDLDIKDPNSVEKSKTWDCGKVKDQIKCLWALYKQN